MAKLGIEYEQFVRAIQQALLDSEQLVKLNNIQVVANKKLVDNCGIEREFDLYWEYELAGICYRTVIECKDYKSKVSVEKIDALLGKIRDLPDIKGVFATKIGYQSGAKKKAAQNKIDLLVVRKESNADWQDGEGNPYIKKIAINLKLVSPARTTSFSPILDGDWVRENTNLDCSLPLPLNAYNNCVIIEDLENNDSYSILELESRLGKSHVGESGQFVRSEEFANAYILTNGLKLKLRSYTLNYTVSRPIELLMDIDYSRELLGVIEYLHKGSKTAVFSDRVVPNWR